LRQAHDVRGEQGDSDDWGAGMPISAEWFHENLGVGASHAAPETLEDSATDTDQQFRRELIDFDSEGPSGEAFQTNVPLAAIGLSHFKPIPWPPKLAPQVGLLPRGQSLPRADVLIVTWTMDEGHALSQVLTPGEDSKTGWKPYTKNFNEIAKSMVPGCPARQLDRLGTYWTCTIGGRAVTLFKSDSHMSQDGPDLPNAKVWKQIIADSQPAWVITTGTGGGIGPSFEVGDVIVSRFVTFDCRDQFKSLNGQTYSCGTEAPKSRHHEAESLFSANAGMLPKTNSRSPKIVTSTSAPRGIVTTDFFGFDNTDDTYQLQNKGDLSEMGDAVLGMVCKELGEAAPHYVIVRNVSDPQIDSAGQTLAQQKALAGSIYQAYGLWSTICSAIVCWSIVASL
jgi:nucleoside phosphorylase